MCTYNYFLYFSSIVINPIKSISGRCLTVFLLKRCIYEGEIIVLCKTSVQLAVVPDNKCAERVLENGS